MNLPVLIKLPTKTPHLANKPDIYPVKLLQLIPLSLPFLLLLLLLPSLEIIIPAVLGTFTSNFYFIYNMFKRQAVILQTLFT